jgi:aryl-alcohol dehydrogenase-like predicted oxidoreductase
MNDKRAKLILGTVQFGLDYGINNKNGQVSRDEAFNILRHSWENGILKLDTAAAYGNSEEVLGDFRKSSPESDFAIITKLAKGTQWKDSLKLSLSALNAKKVDTLLFHSFAAYKKAKAIGEYAEIIDSNSNLFSKLGVSVYTNDELKEVAIDEAIEIIQLPFNLLDNENLRGDAIRFAKQKGKTIHTRSVFLQGLFFKSIENIPGNLSDLAPELSRLQEIAKSAQRSIGELALNYALSKDYVDGVLIGIDSVEQFTLNLKWAMSDISEEHILEIENIHVKNLDLLNPSLWKIQRS